MFEKLRLGVKTDVETRQKLREKHDDFAFMNTFGFVPSAAKFSATYQDPKHRRLVVFSLTDTCILVQDDTDRELFHATVTLNNEKECRILVNQEEMELHGAEATHVESVPVKETHQGKTVWEGVVEVFDLVGHPTANRVYAWGHEY